MTLNAIYFIDNVYVAMPYTDKLREGVNASEIKELVYHKDKKSQVSLYGGRVAFDGSSSGIYLTIDGLNIRKQRCLNSGLIECDCYLGVDTVTAYLNQIENLGVDTFLENYKLQMQQFKAELEEHASKLEAELAMEYSDEKSKVIRKLRESIIDLSCYILAFLFNMNAGLDNHIYTDAYNAIVNLYY